MVDGKSEAFMALAGLIWLLVAFGLRGCFLGVGIYV